MEVSLFLFINKAGDGKVKRKVCTLLTSESWEMKDREMEGAIRLYILQSPIIKPIIVR